MPGTPMPYIVIQEFDDDGDPAAGYQLFTYEAGTTTKLDTFSDYDLTTPNANPIILDSAGRATVYLSPRTYKFVLAPPADTDPPSSPIWTRDDVPAVGLIEGSGDVVATAGENITTTQACFLSSGGGGTTAGRWYRTDTDATSFTAAAAAGAVLIGFPIADLATAEVGTVRIGGRVTGLSGLVAGSSYYLTTSAGAISSTNPGPTDLTFLIGVADSATTLMLTPRPPDQAGAQAQGVISGLVNNLTQYFDGQKIYNTQPQTYVGTATTLPATVGGVFFTDVVEHTIVASTTNGVFTDTGIPANMLSANGKAVKIQWGSSTANTSANAVLFKLDVGGTIQDLANVSATTNWSGIALIVRIDSDSVDVFYYFGTQAQPAIFQKVGRINSLSFTAEIDVRSVATTAAGVDAAQTYFIFEAVG